MSLMSKFVYTIIFMVVLAVVVNVVAYFSQGCDYCKRRRQLRPMYGLISEHAEVRIVYGLLNIHEDDVSVGDTSIKINYCPMCGRKLGD